MVRGVVEGRLYPSRRSLPRAYIAAVAASRESSTGSSYTTPTASYFRGTFSSVWIPDHRTRRFSPPFLCLCLAHFSRTLSLTRPHLYIRTHIHPLSLSLSLSPGSLSLSRSPLFSVSHSPSRFSYSLPLAITVLLLPSCSPDSLSPPLPPTLSHSLFPTLAPCLPCCPFGSIRAHASPLSASPFSRPLSQSTASRLRLLVDLVTWPRVIVHLRRA